MATTTQQHLFKIHLSGNADTGGRGQGGVPGAAAGQPGDLETGDPSQHH